VFERRDGPVLMAQRTACVTLRVPLRGICLAAPTRAARLRPSNATGGGIGILPMMSTDIGKMPMPLSGCCDPMTQGHGRRLM
jgi:hypothetical protein